MASFDLEIYPLLKREGGYVNHPADRGGETNFGISKRAYPSLDIKNLSRDDAKNIYKRDYWDPIKGDDIDDQFSAGQIFDMAVNHGVRTALRMVQEVLNAIGNSLLVADGIMGPATLSALNTAPSVKFNNALVERRIKFYNDIVKRDPSQSVFLTGWLRRAEQFKRGTSASENDNAFLLSLGALVYALYKHLKKGN